MPKNEQDSSPLLNEEDDDNVSTSRGAGRSSFSAYNTTRRSSRRCSKPVVVGIVMLAITAAIGIAAHYSGSDRAWNIPQGKTPSHSEAEGMPASEIAAPHRTMTSKEWEDLEAEQFNPKNFVRGPPTMKYRDNLRQDIKYMSGWIAGGWTNDFMTYINLIYMAHITRPRVPIIGQFHPTHVGEDAGYLHFSTVFDVPRLSRLIRMPVLEWRDVKNETSEEIEEVGCWSAWQISGDSGEPRHSFIPEIVGLDVSYTAAPKEAKMSPEAWNWFVLFWPLAALAYPHGRTAALENNHPQESVLHKAKHPPDEHMVCYDFLYFAGVAIEDEWFADYSPAWREIGTHTHWAPEVEKLTEGYLMRHFNVKTPEEIPQFISVHVRHSDFEGWCGDVPVPECFAPLSDFARRVDEVRAEIKTRHGKDVQRVLMTSDEQDKEWWAGVKALGWTWVDHDAEKTVEKYGKWYPVLVDAVIQSMGQGFVGTDRSTMSMVAQRRVEDWQDGPTREVKWGWKGADDH